MWFVISLAISLVFCREFWTSLGTMLSADWIFGEHHAAPWGMLGLCGIVLWLKRRKLWQEMKPRTNLFFVLPGVALVAGAIFIPSTQDFLVFQVLLASLGVFVILFGRAAKIPTVLLGIYGFVISFPLTVDRFAKLPYTMSVIKPLMWTIERLGHTIESQGQWIHFTSYTGESISALVTTACAGPVTMALFLAIFTLMMFDMPLPPKKAGWLLLLGVAGTWVQSVVRLTIVLLIGYYWGEEAIWTAHFWTIYIMFPLWYLLFAYIYFKQTKRSLQIRREAGHENTRFVET